MSYLYGKKLNITKFLFSGQFVNAGGPGGTRSEPGGAGPMYIHRVPDYDENGDIPENFAENRTLHVNNIGQEPIEPHRNLTSAYENYAEASGVTFVFPGDYPDDVSVGMEIVDPTTDITLDYLMIYQNAQLAMVASTDGADYKSVVNLTTEAMEGDRSGNLHIGYNQTLYIGTGQLPSDLQLYHGSVTTLQGELRAAGVTVTIEGVVASVENITIVDGGKCTFLVYKLSPKRLIS